MRLPIWQGIFGDRGAHSAFVARYGVDERDYPFLMLDTNDWATPFK